MFGRATRRAVVALATLAFLGAAGDLAAETKAGADVTARETWARATPPNAKVGAGYAVLGNTTSEDDRLIGATAEISERVEVHAMEMNDGVMRMRALDGGLALPAGQTVQLEPGGLHLMFMGLKRQLKPGEAFQGTLEFEKAGEVEITFEVR